MINKLLKIPSGKRLKLNDIPIGQAFKLVDDNRRLVKGQKRYFRGRPTTRYYIHEVDLNGNIVKTSDLSLQRTVKPILKELSSFA